MFRNPQPVLAYAAHYMEQTATAEIFKAARALALRVAH